MPETRRRSTLKEVSDKYGKKKKANWFLLRDLIQQADVVLEIIDARDPVHTRLPLAEQWAGSNRLLIIANKVDLLTSQDNLPELSHNGIYVSAKDRSEKTRKTIMAAIRKRARTLPARGVVVGYPNVGKSSIINLLAQKSAAKVSSVAGTTTHVQWIKVAGDILINDYPGVFPPSEKNSVLIRKGALNVSSDAIGPAYEFLQNVLKSPNLLGWLETYYDVELKSLDLSDPEDILAIIAKRRGWLVKGGKPNLDDAAMSVLRAMREAPEL
ncbi:50S ribosome-binding GTPase [Candidatus Micrarchaeota archaeon]|nr:50S ribosome-binding GTPase [Candidatus Micrarchaeota archaeon]